MISNVKTKRVPPALTAEDASQHPIVSIKILVFSLAPSCAQSLRDSIGFVVHLGRLRQGVPCQPPFAGVPFWYLCCS